MALELANHAYIMDRGRIRYTGTADELKNNPELLQTSYLLSGEAAQPGRSS